MKCLWSCSLAQNSSCPCYSSIFPLHHVLGMALSLNPTSRPGIAGKALASTDQNGARDHHCHLAVEMTVWPWPWLSFLGWMWPSGNSCKSKWHKQPDRRLPGIYTKTSSDTRETHTTPQQAVFHQLGNELAVTGWKEQVLQGCVDGLTQGHLLVQHCSRLIQKMCGKVLFPGTYDKCIMMSLVACWAKDPPHYHLYHMV